MDIYTHMYVFMLFLYLQRVLNKTTILHLLLVSKKSTRFFGYVTGNRNGIIKPGPLQIKSVITTIIQVVLTKERLS